MDRREGVDETIATMDLCFGGVFVARGEKIPELQRKRWMTYLRFFELVGLQDSGAIQRIDLIDSK